MTSVIKEILNPVPFSNKAIADGSIPGITPKIILGFNPDIDATPDEDLWVYGGTYTFSSSAVAHSISSSNAGDTQNIRVTGLDSNWDQVTVTVALQGQTKVSLGQNFLRINEVRNVGSSNLLGNAYVYESTATLTAGVPNEANLVRGMIQIGLGIAEQAIFSVPNNYCALIQSLAFTADIMGSAVCKLMVRDFGQAFRLAYPRIASKEVTVLHTYASGICIPAKSDIKIVVDSAAVNAICSGGFEMLLYQV